MERKDKENQKLKSLLDETNKQMERFVNLFKTQIKKKYKKHE